MLPCGENTLVGAQADLNAPVAIEESYFCPALSRNRNPAGENGTEGRGRSPDLQGTSVARALNSLRPIPGDAPTLAGGVDNRYFAHKRVVAGSSPAVAARPRSSVVEHLNALLPLVPRPVVLSKRT